MKRFSRNPSWLIVISLITSLLLGACSNEPTSKDTNNTKVDTVAKEKTEKKAESEEQSSVQTADEENKNEPVAEPKQSQEELAKSLGLELVTVGRVVDGDTIVTSDGRKVRFVGVNTPESTTRHEVYGKEASNYTKSKLEGKQVWLQKDVSSTDRYGRYLRIIWMGVPTNDMDEAEIRSKMFNADLVLNGYAEPSTYPPDVKYSEFFVKFAREAREANKGLWSYGADGTTKGDLDGSSTSKSSGSYSTGSSTSSGSSSSGTDASTSAGTKSEVFQNCTELRKVYPNGVPAGHPAYQAKMDRDKDNYACEQ
ncbi:thermonuclease family protein [Neobacillus sp. GCM10023253]|uniref:thermonuclease family protein n=1 Tax=Neobacillus sp. GCM10023253 TaxID=3252644 RepID=UPI0036234BBB